MKSFCDVTFDSALFPHVDVTSRAFLGERLAKLWADTNQQVFPVNNDTEQIALENILLRGIFDIKLDLG